MKNDRVRKLCFAVYVSHAPVHKQELNYYIYRRKLFWSETWTAVEQAFFLGGRMCASCYHYCTKCCATDTIDNRVATAQQNRKSGRNNSRKLLPGILIDTFLSLRDP